MKKIRLNYVGFWTDFDKNDNLFTNILKEKYEVEISDNPDFVIASPLGEPLEYLKYDCVRILFTGEPLVPDFNVFDYAIGFDRLSFPDDITGNRYYRYPLCFYNYEAVKAYSKGLSYEEAKKALDQKKYFCNFLYGHRSAKGEREKIFDCVQKYKRVESAGSFMNNMEDGKIVPYSSEKMEFLKLCKFTISCESISYPGFITEKLMNPFSSRSVPIYYGNPHVADEFNVKAMINLHDYSTIEEGIERVKQIDHDDDLYIQMLMEDKLKSEDYLDNLYNGLQEFLWAIFAQDPQSAYRRMRFYIQKEHEKYLDEYRKFHNSIEYRIFRKRLKIKQKV